MKAVCVSKHLLLVILIKSIEESSKCFQSMNHLSSKIFRISYFRFAYVMTHKLVFDLSRERILYDLQRCSLLWQGQSFISSSCQ